MLGIPTPAFSSALAFFDGYRFALSNALSNTLSLSHTYIMHSHTTSLLPTHSLTHTPKLQLTHYYVCTYSLFNTPHTLPHSHTRSERVPANLIQAQRDYFGAHTYELLTKPGTFTHTNWTGHGGNVSASTYSA